MIVFTDIDDTLMRTTRKCVGDVSQLRLGAVSHKGLPISYIDKKREKLLDEFIDKAVSIPVSARSVASFKNLRISFNHHAILNFGATILDKNGELDMRWHDVIMTHSNCVNQKKVFESILNSFAELLKGFEVKTPTENEISVYANFRDNEFVPGKLDNLREVIVEHLKSLNMSEHFYMYQTDRDLALIPKFIKKETAVEYLLDNHYSKDELIVGLGDHKNDLSFMGICDFVMFPTDSMLMKLIRKAQ